MEHTPEPWTIKVIEPNWEISGEMEARIEASVKADGEVLPDTQYSGPMLYNIATLNFIAMKRNKFRILRNEGEANARRIVACVNACAGLSIEDLERSTGLTLRLDGKEMIVLDSWG